MLLKIDEKNSRRGISVLTGEDGREGNLSILEHV